MKFILQPLLPANRAQLGGKAAALAALEHLPVPPWFVVTPAAFVASVGDVAELPERISLAPEVLSELTPAVAALGGDAFAVRSSAIDEDGATFSFAGQLESFLHVPAAEIPRRVIDVWRSGFSPRLRAYREEHGLSAKPTPPAVLVQRMVHAMAAGVAFSADPVSGRRGVAVVSAVAGTADKLVSGETNAETFRVGRSGNILERTEPEVVGQAPTPVSSLAGAPACGSAGEGVRETMTGVGACPTIITDKQVRAIAALARAAEEHFGRPQDIEWAIEDGKLWLLQSRPITTLSALADPDGELRLWDNSNIAESYGGITTPLTYSFARRAYEEVYRQFCRLMRVPESTIAANADTFRCMIGLVRGRVYYNLVSWHRVLAMLPGYAINRAFMEQMMGVKESLPDEINVAPATNRAPSKIREAVNLIRTCAGLVKNHFTLAEQIAAFYARLNIALSAPAVPLAQMRPDELVAHYRDLERRLLTRWDAPLVNDFFAMIFHGALRKLCARWCGSAEGALANELIRDCGDIISAEPARRLRVLAELAAPHEGLLAALQQGDAAAVRRGAKAVPAFAAELNDYLARFGDRCLDELKLESETLNDDPAPLLRSIAALATRTEPERRARCPQRAANVSGASSPPRRAEDSAPYPSGPANSKAVAVHGPFRSAVFNWVLRHARVRVRDRENLRFERTRLFGRVRRIFLELGKRLHACGCLDAPRDVFYLELNELVGFVDGTGTTTDLKSLVTVRRAEFERFRQLPPPADRFETRGMVNHANAFQRPAHRAQPELNGDVRQGLACCAGVVRGRTRVISDPRTAVIERGEILVAERTDPGWIMLFPAASGVLVERGSLLSHSAIVSRELGLPGIVSIPGLTTWLKTGDLIEMDGATGVVKRIETA